MIKITMQMITRLPTCIFTIETPPSTGPSPNPHPYHFHKTVNTKLPHPYHFHQTVNTKLPHQFTISLMTISKY